MKQDSKKTVETAQAIVENRVAQEKTRELRTAVKAGGGKDALA